MQPENELGVIALFAQQAQGAGFELVSIQANYPDAIIRRNNEEYRTEFEYRASNFVDHRHDPRDCDLIICWENDWPNSMLPILALSDPGWKDVSIRLAAEAEKIIAYWQQRAIRAESANQGGRPPIAIDPVKIAHYLVHRPDKVTQREAQEVFSLGRRLHEKHRDFTKRLVSEVMKLDVDFFKRNQDL